MIDYVDEERLEETQQRQRMPVMKLTLPLVMAIPL